MIPSRATIEVTRVLRLDDDAIAASAVIRESTEIASNLIGRRDKISGTWPNVLTKNKMTNMIIGTEADMSATIRHDIRLPRKRARNRPMFIAIDELAVNAPRNEGSL